MAPITGQLDVGNASIYYEDHGSPGKPTLLLIPPGNGICLYYETLIPHLLSAFRVITFDRRGFHRSSIRSPKDINILEANSNDCAALIECLSPNNPVAVFAPSGNATIGLILLHQHPGLIAKLILHEPILPTLHPPHEATAAQTLMHKTREIYSTSGAAAANRYLIPHVSTKRDLAELAQTPVLKDLAAIKGNSSRQYFVEELPAIAVFEVDAASVRNSVGKVVLARGEYLAVRLAEYPISRLGHLLGKEPVRFPGGHNGYVTHPEEFVKRLVTTFSRGLEGKL